MLSHLRLGARQGGLLSHFLVNTVQNVLASVRSYQTEIKGTQIRNEEIRLSLLTNDVIVYIENLK